jgi:hypothetical protein
MCLLRGLAGLKALCSGEYVPHMIMRVRTIFSFVSKQLFSID